MNKFIKFFTFFTFIMSTWGCVKTEGQDAASAYGIRKSDYLTVDGNNGEAALANPEAPQTAAAPAEDPEKVRLLREIAQLRAQQTSRSNAGPDSLEVARRRADVPEAPTAPPVLRGFPLPGVAGGPSLGMGAMMPGGGVSIVEWRPAIVRAQTGYVLWIENRQEDRYVAIELPNGADYLAPCNGNQAGWRPVVDIHSRLPVWVLPPGARAALCQPLYKCPQARQCKVAVRAVRYTFSDPYARRENRDIEYDVVFGGSQNVTWPIHD